MASALILVADSEAVAQRKTDWNQPDTRYVDHRGWSLGFNIGMSDMWGDVGTRRVIDHYVNNIYFDNVTLMGGVYGKYTHLPGLSFRIGVGFGTIYATDQWNSEVIFESDKITDDYVQRHVRNLDAKSKIWEGSLMVEVSPFELFSNWEFGKTNKWRIQPYIMAGVAGFNFNPQGTNIVNYETGQSKMVDLRPLRTEGQGYSAEGYPEIYNQFALAIPMGIGVRYDIGKSLGIGLEFVTRYTFTDYLDDVSGKYVDPLRTDIAYLNQGYYPDLSNKMADRSNEVVPGLKHQAGEYRGDPNNKDMYSSLSINFFWRINKRSQGWWK